MEAPASVPAKKPRPKLPLGLTAVLAIGLVVGIFGDFYASAYVQATTARADGAIVNAAARAPGTLAEVRAEEGARVVAGQIVARLQDDDLRAAVLQAEAELAGARAGLAASRTTAALQPNETTMNVATADANLRAMRAALAAAQAAVGQARSEHARLQGLVASEIVSRQQLETAAVAIVTARADADAARARVLGAEGALRHARTTIGQEAVQRETVGVGQASLQRAEALLALAKLRLATADVKAPAGGLVVRRLAQPGESVGAGQAVLAIADSERIWVTAQVAESEATRVHEGAAALVRFDALPGKRFAGRVAFVAAATAEASGSAPTPAPNTLRLPSQVPVRIVLDAPDPALRPGLTASVRIEARR